MVEHARPFRRRWSVLAMALWLAGCGPSDRAPVGPEVAAVVNGERTMAHPEVVAILGVHGTGEDRLCTGTLISPYVVLTAKHCVFERQPDGTHLEAAPDRMLVMVTDDITAREAMDIEIPREVRYPGRRFTPHDLSAEDIAAILMPRAFVFPPAYVATLSPAIGDPLTLVGFGLNSAGPEGEAGRKYVGTATVDFVGEEISATGPSYTCLGDSGGPAFDARGDIVGVTSAGIEGCTTRSYFAPVARHAAFIDEVIRFVPPPPDAGVTRLDAGAAALDAGRTSIDSGEEPPIRGSSGDAGCTIASRVRAPSTGWAAALGVGCVCLAARRRFRARLAAGTRHG